MADESKFGRVYLVGAGPGDPGLLTLRAVECLRDADFVLYDFLTSPRALDFTRPDAERLCADEIPGEHPQRWPHIHRRIIEEAQNGKTVVHLKGGDPLIFGRGGEEAEAIRAAGIPYEIVPGVTAALAAGAYTEIPLTHRAHASAVAFVTGHEHPGKANSRLDWDALARFPGTLAIYMGVARLGIISRELITRGMSPETPAAFIHQASTGEQRTVVGTLATLEEQVRQAGLTSPSLMLVGPVVTLKPPHSWFEAKPLFGLRVLVTRPRELARDFARKLELFGAVPSILPVLDIRPPADWAPADRTVDRLQSGQYDWLVFTSTNGVTAFLGRLEALGLDARAIGRAQIAAIGTATAQALHEFHLRPNLLPSDEMHSDRLAELLIQRCHGKRVLIACATQARELLRERLAAVATVDVAPVYDQAPGEPSAEVLDCLRRGEVDVVTLTSPNIARAFLAACDETIRQRLRDGTTRLLGNSQRLADWLNEQGISAFVSNDPTMDGLIASLIQLAGKREDGLEIRPT
jgi:uroporphyrinogen III methyltransferase/synthase